LPPLP